MRRQPQLVQPGSRHCLCESTLYFRGAVYTVEVAGTEYELTPDHSRVAKASAYLPLSATILKESSLANHMPGTAVKLRRDDDGFLVLVGRRESHYRVFVAH